MKKFFRDIKKYNPYALYAAKAELKSGVADSYLNWLWWILDPILFMLIYTFVVRFVFNTSEDYFAVFVFIGLTVWDLFNRTATNSVKLVKTNKSTVTKIYIPKYVLILIKMYVNLFKMLISFALVVICMLIYGVPVGWTVVFIPLILLVLITVTFSCSLFFMHFGVFIEDLSNVVAVLLRLLFYMSGIFYSIGNRIGKVSHIAARLLTNVNPIALIIDSMRKVMLYNKVPNITMLLLWFAVSVAVSAAGVYTIYKYENSYTKVI